MRQHIYRQRRDILQNFSAVSKNQRAIIIFNLLAFIACVEKIDRWRQEKNLAAATCHLILKSTTWRRTFLFHGMEMETIGNGEKNDHNKPQQEGITTKPG